MCLHPHGYIWMTPASCSEGMNCNPEVLNSADLILLQNKMPALTNWLLVPVKQIQLFISASTFVTSHLNKHTYFGGNGHWTEAFILKLVQTYVARGTRSNVFRRPRSLEKTTTCGDSSSLCAWKYLSVITANDLPLHPILDCIFSIMRSFFCEKTTFST